MEEDSGFDLRDIVSISKSLIEELPYFDKEEDCLVANFTEGGNYPVVVLTGENAMGKSFLRRLYQVMIKSYAKIECIHLSQQGRSSGSFPSAFIYGDESWESTGQITSRTITTCINTSASREDKNAIIWDEPEIGLSDSYAAGAGLKIREFIECNNENLFGVIVISHSKYLIKQLLPLNPHHLRVGDNKSLDSFLNETVEPKNIEELSVKAVEMFRKIEKIIKRKG